MIKLKNIAYRILSERIDEEDLWEMYSDMIETVIQEFQSKKYKSQPWPLVKYSTVKRVWSDFMKNGFVRDEDLVEDIASSFIQSYLKLSVNTFLLGHTSSDPSEEFEERGMSEDDVEEFYDWTDIIDKNGYITYRLSDYALDKLHPIIVKIINANTAEEKLLKCDQLLNVIHMRSDLSSWFVEGGKRSLDDLAGYTKGEEL